MFPFIIILSEFSNEVTCVDDFMSINLCQIIYTAVVFVDSNNFPCKILPLTLVTGGSYANFNARKNVMAISHNAFKSAQSLA